MLEKILFERAAREITERAVKGLSPGLTADLVLEQAGEANVRRIFTQPDWLDQIAAVDPRATACGPWFQAFANEIADALRGDGDEAL